MADISQIKLPDGNTYDIKDTTARSLINGIFVLAWNGVAAPTVANIPDGIQVTYNNTIYTGTLAANNNTNTSTLGKIYLVKSTTLPDDDDSDIYNEYVTVDNGSSANPRYTWEKLGDTRIKLGNIVTNVELDKKTATVVGTGAGLKVSTQPAFNVTPNTTYVKGTASGTNVVYTPTDDNKDTFVKSVSATTKKLVTTTVTGVSGSVTASKVSAGTDQTTAKGTGTASTSTDAWIKGWSVSNELLTLGGVSMDTQTTTQVNIDTPSVTVPKAAATATRVATGSLADTDTNGATIATGVSTSGSGQTAKALVSLPNPTITQPTISLSTNSTGGTGQATVAANTQVAASRATNVAIAWDGQDSKTVLLNTTSLTVSKAT